MKPIGLTFKKDGELMIVHKCLNCGKISRNRIAGDDNPYAIVPLSNEEDKQAVLTILYGYDYQKYLK